MSAWADYGFQPRSFWKRWIPRWVAAWFVGYGLGTLIVQVFG